ncbi:MAG: branched-chain amino acid ABC transporter permease [Chloroflexota bacterium]|nr:MAG: branched-chain amino acid ABC transporter permease [Chloroflexota bacterium]
MKETLSDTRIRTVAIIVLAVALVGWPLLGGSSYYWHIATIALIGVILSLGLNVFLGWAGQANFGAAAFYALGAYATALIEIKVGIHFLLAALVIAPLVAGVVALALSYPLLRLRGHALAVGTLSLAYVFYIVVLSWTGFTGGENGLQAAIPTMFGESIRAGVGAYYVTLAAAALSATACILFTSSRHGRALKALGANEMVASTMGIDILTYKRVAYVLNGVLCGLAGGLLTIENGMIAPAYFDVWQNIVIFLMVIVGGMGSNVGAMIGGAFIMLLPEALASFKEYAIIMYGAVLLLAVRFTPKGLAGLLQLGWTIGTPKTRERRTAAFVEQATREH